MFTTYCQEWAPTLDNQRLTLYITNMFGILIYINTILLLFIMGVGMQRRENILIKNNHDKQEILAYKYMSYISMVLVGIIGIGFAIFIDYNSEIQFIDWQSN